MIIQRRNFLVGLTSILAAPAIIKVSAIMPIKVYAPEWRYITSKIWDDGQDVTLGFWAKAGVEKSDADLVDTVASFFGYDGSLIIDGGGGILNRNGIHALDDIRLWTTQESVTWDWKNKRLVAGS